MFQTTVKKAIKVPGFNYLHIVGADTKGSVRVGDYITDGNKEFEITSIPIIRKVDDTVVDEVDICISPGDFDLSDIVGKTIYAV
jgi:hypothetical protein